MRPVIPVLLGLILLLMAAFAIRQVSRRAPGSDKASETKALPEPAKTVPTPAKASQPPAKRSPAEMVVQLYGDETTSNGTLISDVWAAVVSDGKDKRKIVVEPVLLPVSPSPTRKKMVESFGEPTTYSDKVVPGLMMAKGDGSKSSELKAHMAWYGAIGFGLTSDSPDASVIALAYDPTKDAAK
ncbi:MAG: hypothetical protein ABFE08_13735 [Armatimonadia bacterium]